MESNKTTLSQTYQLLKNVLHAAFLLPVELFTPPYTDIKKIDLGLRAMFWSDYNDDASRFSFLYTPDRCRILIVKSNLGFYNVLALLGHGELPDFFSVGPFRDEDLSPNYFSQILKDSHIMPEQIQSLKQIYEQMPYAKPDAVSAVTKHILSGFYPEFLEVTPELLQYADQNRAIAVNTDLLAEYTAEHAEQYRSSLRSFLDTLKTGDSQKTKKAMQNFLENARFVHDQSMREYKWLLQCLNISCHAELLSTGIHPYHIIRLMISNRTKIETTTSMAKLEQMPGEICHKYSLLVKNYANTDYSRLTKDVADYIQLHMDEDLSLHLLATHFGKNPSVLSNTFSKETGTSLTKFIQQTRIREAIRLFNTTDLSVSEVALSVGYQDFSYFSKVFSKITGKSPKAYKSRGISAH